MIWMVALKFGGKLFYKGFCYRAIWLPGSDFFLALPPTHLRIPIWFPPTLPVSVHPFARSRTAYCGFAFRSFSYCCFNWSYFKNVTRHSLSLLDISVPLVHLSMAAIVSYQFALDRNRKGWVFLNCDGCYLYVHGIRELVVRGAGVPDGPFIPSYSVQVSGGQDQLPSPGITQFVGIFFST